MKKTCNITVLLLLAAALLGSCKKDPDTHVRGGKEKEVEMTFVTPSPTRAAIEAEDALMDVTLLVFEGKAATSKFLYSRYTWRSAAGGNKFRTTLQMGDGLTIYFAANAKSFIEGLIASGKLEAGATTWADAQKVLVLDTPTGFDPTGKGLPMWGHAFDVDIADQPDNNLGKIDLLRAAASTDVKVIDTDFALEKGHLVFAANKGNLFYDPAMLSGDQVTGPKSPTGMTTTVEWTKGSVVQNEISNYFYMYENDTPLAPTTGTNRPTKVILEGKWKGGATTFYPLTFRNKNTLTGDYDEKQVTRNNKYLIVVTEVKGDGWKDIGEAKNADDVNMEYAVIQWNENEDGDIMIDGPKFFYRASSSVTLGFEQGSKEEVVIRTNFDLADIRMKFGASGTGVAGTVSNDRFKAEVVDDSGNACFRFTALKPYGNDTENPSTLYVTVGRLSFTFLITQADRKPGGWDDGGGQQEDLGQ